jgi:hypothetical protein
VAGMNMLPALAHAFGVEPATLERLVEAYENPDRLPLVEARWREAGCGDADKGWLIEEVKAKRDAEPAIRQFLWLNHGCPISRLYGDDGEMQCCGGPANRPHRPLDFLRQPIGELITALKEDWRRNAEHVLRGDGLPS